jgi:hypothetical protein
LPVLRSMEKKQEEDQIPMIPVALAIAKELQFSPTRSR